MEIKGKYIYKNDFTSNFVNGVYGGPKDNKIVMNFYFESYDIPEQFSYKTDNNNKSENAQPTNSVTRTVCSQLVMDVPTAKAFRDWLDYHIKRMDG